ncbi:IS1595 family transposase [Chitinophaga caeni]|uniref:IS1595 family transposase n=1 Tax=Chitinophaga caeni TaxID=2029983 RepID=A0A291QSB7_9BACT|nr:IS1595 family transposase [Chitinophaga caeni]ATL46860.1 IS1595 family transposase [Chitinophaga caeni]
MKNKFLKGAHLSERKFKEILKLFSEDLTATQIASISGVSRVTVNSYLKKIRSQIVKSCEETSPVPVHSLPKIIHAKQPVLQHDGDVEDDALRLNVERNNRPVIFGIYHLDSQVFTEIIPDISRSMIQAVVRGRSILETVGTADRIRKYNGVVDLGQYRLYHLPGQHLVGAHHQHIIDDVDGFWILTKHRLAKFKGLNRNTVYLHLKECEFRYNHRTRDLYNVLLDLLKNYPLNLS